MSGGTPAIPGLLIPGSAVLGMGVSAVPLQITNVIAIAENVVRIYFSAAPYLSGLLDTNDASNPAFYDFEPVAGTSGRDGFVTRQVFALFAALGGDPNSIDVTLDRPMSPDPAQYTVTVQGVATSSGGAGMMPTAVSFPAVCRVYVPPQTDTAAASAKDFANPSTQNALAASTVGVPTQSGLGSYQHDDSGDYAIDQGLQSYKKRCLRRLVTRPGGFGFLGPTYGVGVVQLGKKLQKSGVVGKTAAAAQSQIALEPETAAVSVTTVQDPARPQLVYFVMKGKTKSGQPVSFAVPFRTT